MNHGISILQGPHHVAQKSSRITLPFSDSRLTSLLAMSFSVYFSAAGLALAGHAAPVPGGAAASTWLKRSCHGSALNVSSASASALTVATAHRIFIARLPCQSPPPPASGL